jgi:serine/threonine protein kinase, bacterial
MKKLLSYSILIVLIACLAACSKSSNTPSGPRVATVTVFAGSGTLGGSDGTGVSAEFGDPGGLALDGSGNLYVADQNNAMIRKITSAAAVTTLAGSFDNYGYADGTGAQAQFFDPTGVAVDAAGNIYVADVTNNDIRKITPAGLVTTLAGGKEGYADGTGTAAQFFSPSGVAVDGAGNVYVTDTYNQRIRKITPAGVVTTLAGSGATGPGNGGYADGAGTTQALFNAPSGIAIDPSGNLYVADYNNSKIRKVTPSGVVSTIAGSGVGEADGQGAAAEFGGPTGIALDRSGNIYVTDRLSTVREVTQGGVVTTIAGATGTPTAGVFSQPTGIVVDPSGNIYVADASTQVISKITF